MRRTRQQLTFANVVSVTALFVALGGTAVASVIITSNGQVAQNTISGHKPPSGKHPNIIAGSISGTDIADRSGVDTCQTPLTAKFGPICVGSDGGARNWFQAISYCNGFGLRLPTLSEALALATNYDVPGVSASQRFWTDEELYEDAYTVNAVDDDGGFATTLAANAHQTVCVTDPSA